VSAERGPWIDLHGHAGRCFLAGLPARHPMVTALGAASIEDAVRAARAAGMTALMLATVSDFAVLQPDCVTGLRHTGTSAPARRTPVTAVSWRPSAGA
jgi:hypothetical protein